MHNTRLGRVTLLPCCHLTPGWIVEVRACLHVYNLHQNPDFFFCFHHNCRLFLLIAKLLAKITFDECNLVLRPRPPSELNIWFI